MTFSFGVRANNKAEAKAQVAAAIASAVNNQAIHSQDLPQLNDMIDMHLEKMHLKENHDIVVNAHGSANYEYIEQLPTFTGTQMTVHVYQTPQMG